MSWFGNTLKMVLNPAGAIMENAKEMRKAKIAARTERVQIRADAKVAKQEAKTESNIAAYNAGIDPKVAAMSGVTSVVDSVAGIFNRNDQPQGIALNPVILLGAGALVLVLLIRKK